MRYEKTILIIIAVLVIVAVVVAAFVFINRDEPVEFTPIENRAYTYKTISVEPDTEKYVKMVAIDTGNDVYTPAKSRAMFIVTDHL